MRRHSMLLILPLLILWTGCAIEEDLENENAEATPDDRENENAEATPDDRENENAEARPDDRQPEKGVAELKLFNSAEELEEYFKEQIRAGNDQFAFYRGGDGEVDTDFADGSEPGTVADEELGQAVADAEPVGAEGEGESALGDEAPVATQDGDDGSFSETTTQEVGVDEADVVKTDGDYLYVMTGQDLRIVRAVPADQLEELSRFELNGWGRDLYLVGDTAVALTSPIEAFYPGDVAIAESESSAEGSDGVATQVSPEPRQDLTEPADDVGEPAPDLLEPLPLGEPSFFAEPWFIPRPKTQVTIIDISDRSAPTLISQTVFDGRIASSRMIDGVLRLVLANYPQDYYDILPLGATDIDEQIEALDLDALLPDYQTTDAAGQSTRGNIMEWDAFYRPTDPDGFGLTAIVTLDSSAPESFESVAMVAEPGLIYASTEALYVTDTQYYYDFRRVDTDIYKFTFEPGTVTLAGAGTVKGRILNQYSMGEYEGYLRVATTTDALFDWESGQSMPGSNNVYILGETDGKLAVVGAIENLAVNEEIKSARFIGSRGYLVTFERMDPLFTLDLSNPADPLVVGELKIPGFSTFIVPMDEDHLLTVGTYVDPQAGWARNDGVQLSIFDVSDFANPQQTHTLIIGDAGTYSEATWDPKAFTYFAPQGLVALPIEHWGYGDEFLDEDGGFAVEDVEDGSTRQTATPPFEESERFRGLYAYGVSAEEGFDYLGRISTVLNEKSSWGSSFTRGVFIEDHVYAVTDQAVVCAPLADLDEVVAAIELPHENGPDDAVVPTEPAPAPNEVVDSGGDDAAVGDGG